MSDLIYERVDRYGNLVKFSYSKCDELLVMKHTWHHDSNGYAVTNIRIDGKYKLKKFHRLALGEPVGGIDHRNGNTRDNTRGNLRECTQSENMMNTRLSAANTSGVKGVHWHKCKKKWCASIGVNRKLIALGSFPNKDSAIKARMEAEYVYFGEYRRVSNGSRA